MYLQFFFKFEKISKKVNFVLTSCVKNT